MCYCLLFLVVDKDSVRAPQSVLLLLIHLNHSPIEHQHFRIASSASQQTDNMRVSSILMAAAATAVNAQRPKDTSICDYYTSTSPLKLPQSQV